MKSQYVIAKPSGKEELNVIKAFLEALNIEFDIAESSSADKEYSLTDEQLHILEERKEKHLKKESKSYNWEEIKDDLKNPSK